VVAEHADVIIIGAGAAGLICALEAGKRGRRVLVLDKAKKQAARFVFPGGVKAILPIWIFPLTTICRRTRISVNRRWRVIHNGISWH
jgi:flavin-dependent dehydrogenase